MAMSNELTFLILKLLSDGKFHSGEAMAQRFNVSRTSIWNALQHAEQLGVEVFSVRGRGYKLPQAFIMLDKHAIMNALGVSQTQFKLEVHDHLSSTNTYLMQNLSTHTHATCVATNLQTQGRGRRGSQWQAGLGASLTFSLLWRFQCGASALSGLSLAVGLALIRGLQQLGINNTQLKWPNDVLVLDEKKQGKKLAGILIELQGDMEGPSTAVIGIGINLKLPESLKKQIDQPVTDLASISNQKINPNALLAILLKHLTEVITTFEHHGFEKLHDEWTQLHAYQNQAVRMIMPDGRETQGVVRGLTENGSLLVETEYGLKRFISGEISLRGV